jgi:hypothetical protein
MKGATTTSCGRHRGATILEYVTAGLIDEFSIALSPVLLGSGIRLFEGVDAARGPGAAPRSPPEGDAPDLRSREHPPGDALDHSGVLVGGFPDRQGITALCQVVAAGPTGLGNVVPVD